MTASKLFKGVGVVEFLPFTHAWTKQRKARRGPGNTVWVSTSAGSLSTLDLFIDLLWNQNWGGGGCDACPVDRRRLSESSCLPTFTTDSLSTLMLCIVYPSKLQQKSCLALSLSPHVISCTGAWERGYKYTRRIPVLWAWVAFPTWHSVYLCFVCSVLVTSASYNTPRHV